MFIVKENEIKYQISQLRLELELDKKDQEGYKPEYQISKFIRMHLNMEYQIDKEVMKGLDIIYSSYYFESQDERDMFICSMVQELNFAISKYNYRSNDNLNISRFKAHHKDNFTKATLPVSNNVHLTDLREVEEAFQHQIDFNGVRAKVLTLPIK